ncbi:glycosyltransferase [Aerococcaceae bacterium WGS1372]
MEFEENMINIVHIITGLGSGGAENMLYKVIKYSDKNKYKHIVISLTDKGTVGKKIELLDVEVIELNLSLSNSIQSFSKLRSIVKNQDVVNTWLYHADLIGYFVTRFLNDKKLIWNIRHSDLSKKSNQKSILVIAKINAFLSKNIDVITFNSDKAIDTHTAYGYRNKNMIVVPNGFETEKFQFNPEVRLETREKLKIKKNEKVFITVGRWHLQKDYYTLLKALEKVNKKSTSYKMIMIGTDLDWDNKELREEVYNRNLQENVILLGIKNNINDYLSAADCYISSSFGESFSNSIGEAMACQLDLIVTDVGDSKKIVSDTGVVVPPVEPEIMAEEIYKYIEKNEIFRNDKSRERISIFYDIKNVVKLYENIYGS